MVGRGECHEFTEETAQKVPGVVGRFVHRIRGRFQFVGRRKQDQGTRPRTLFDNQHSFLRGNHQGEGLLFGGS